MGFCWDPNCALQTRSKQDMQLQVLGHFGSSLVNIPLGILAGLGSPLSYVVQARWFISDVLVFVEKLIRNDTSLCFIPQCDLWGRLWSKRSFVNVRAGCDDGACVVLCCDDSGVWSCPVWAWPRVWSCPCRARPSPVRCDASFAVCCSCVQIALLASALRVLPAETRLTVYRRLYTGAREYFLDIGSHIFIHFAFSDVFKISLLIASGNSVH